MNMSAAAPVARRAACARSSAVLLPGSTPQHAPGVREAWSAPRAAAPPGPSTELPAGGPPIAAPCCSVLGSSSGETRCGRANSGRTRSRCGEAGGDGSVPGVGDAGGDERCEGRCAGRAAEEPPLVEDAAVAAAEAAGKKGGKQRWQARRRRRRARRRGGGAWRCSRADRHPHLPPAIWNGQTVSAPARHKPPRHSTRAQVCTFDRALVSCRLAHLSSARATDTTSGLAGNRSSSREEQGVGDLYGLTGRVGGEADGEVRRDVVAAFVNTAACRHLFSSLHACPPPLRVAAASAAISLFLAFSSSQAARDRCPARAR